jgi:hypothetical protein
MPRISVTLSSTGTNAPGAKRERALSRPESIATRLTSIRYGKVIRDRLTASSNLPGTAWYSRASSQTIGHIASIATAENPSSTHTNTDSTSPANRSAASSPPSPCSAREYIGTKATENAPSANSRRNVFGRMNASCHASAASPAPSTRAVIMSRAKPNTRLTAVSPPIVPTFLTRLLTPRRSG